MARTRVVISVGVGQSLWKSVAQGAVSFLREALDCEIYVPEERLATALLPDLSCQGLIVRVGSRELSRVVAAKGLPAVNVSGILEDAGFPLVWVDDGQIGRIAAQHLLRQGFRSFAYFGDVTAFSLARERAFVGALGAAGYACPVHPKKGTPSDPLEFLRAQVEAAGRQPLGVMCSNDDRADSIATRCKVAGFAIPGKVAILGVDNEDTVALRCRVPLTSVELPAFSLGREAARLLCQLLRGERPPREPLLLPPSRVIVRQSTDVLAIADPCVRAAVSFIRANADRRCGVSEVLRAAGALSRRSLEYRFRKAVGATVHDEIQRARLERAKGLLLTTDLKLAEVARLSGYRSLSHFSWLFHSVEGRRPAAWRRLLGKGRNT